MHTGRRISVLLLALLCAASLGADVLSDRIASAENGDSIDQFDLATAYFWGRDDIPQDYKQAYVWYTVSFDAGMGDEAAERRDKAAAHLSAEEIEQAKTEAAALTKKIAELHK
jgi:TPR repeat protein